MGSLSVSKIEVVLQSFMQCPPVSILMQEDMFVLHVAPQSFDFDVFVSGIVHRHRNTERLKCLGSISESARWSLKCGGSLMGAGLQVGEHRL